MPLGYESASVSEDVSLQEFEPSWQSKLGAAADEAWKESYLPVLIHGVQQFQEGVRARAAGERFLSADEVNAKIKESGLKVNLTARDGELSEGQLGLILERQRELTQIRDIRNRTPWDWGSPIRGLAMFGAGIADPVNLGTAFVPWTRIMPVMRSLEAARLSASPLTRLAGRVGTGAIDGGVTTLALEPVYAAVRNAIGDDYDAADSMANIAFGTAFGGGVLGIGGAGLDVFRKVTGRSGPSARYRGLSVDQIEKVTKFEADFKAGKLDFDTVKSTLDRMTDTERLAAGFDDVKMRAINEPVNPLFHSITSVGNRVTVSGIAGRVDATVQNGAMVIDSQTVIPTFRGSEHAAAMIERMIAYATDNNLPVVTGKTVSKEAAGVIQSLAAKGIDVRMREGTVEMPDGSLKNASGPVFELAETPNYTRPTDNARAILERIEQSTREAGLQTGVSQMLDGRPIDVETVIFGDPQAGSPLSEAEIRARVEQNSAPEAHSLSDPDASAVADIENQRASKLSNIQEAEAAQMEADAALNETIQSGDQAFKFSREQQAPRLLAVHDLSQENLLFTDEFGGLAVPSIGVVTEDAGGLNGQFGDITLIGNRSLVDPRQVPVFSADAYAETFPRPQWSKVKVSEARKVANLVYETDREFGNGLGQQTLDQMSTKPNANELVEAWLRSTSSRVVYLRSIGIDVQPVMMDRPSRTGLPAEVLQELQPFVDAIDMNMGVDAVKASPEYLALQQEFARVVTAYYEKFNIGPRISQPIVDSFGFGFVDRMSNDIKGIGKQVLDRTKTDELVDGLIQPKANDFLNWVNQTVLSKFGDPHILLGNKKAPYTLENIVSFMAKREQRGAEKTPNFGSGKTKAVSSMRFKDLEQMRLVAKESIVDPEKAGEVRAETEQTVSNYRDMMLDQPHEYNDTWAKMDASMQALALWIRGKDKTEKGMKAALKRVGFTEVDKMSADDIKFAVLSATALAKTPVPYFEAKPPRAVDLGEFSGAVVPEDISPQALAILEKNGIPVKFYSGENKQEAVRLFAKELAETNNDVLFSRGTVDPTQTAQKELEQSLEDMFGGDVKALLDAGKIRIVNTAADIPGDIPADVKGATLEDGSLVYLVAENLNENNIKSVVLHEVGVHVGMEKMLGTELFNDVLTQVDKAIAKGESWALAAKAAVPEKTKPEHIREEQLAYLVEFSPELPLVKRIIAAVRAWAYKTFKYAQENLILTEADFRALAASSLRYAARMEKTKGRMIGGRLVSAFSRSIEQIESKAFKDWFGGSKVVDEDGKPLVVYHGTGKSFNIFDLKTDDILDTGAFFSSKPAIANMYAAGSTENVLPVYLSIKNPMIIDVRGNNWNKIGQEAMVNGKPIAELAAEFSLKGQQTLAEGRITTNYLSLVAKSLGYDGVIFKNVVDIGPSGKYITEDAGSPGDVYVAFDPTAIKSATGNIGTFDATSPDIRFSRGETPDPADAKQELGAADRALARVRSYSNVLRVAADKLDDDSAAVAAMRQQMPDITAEEIDSLLAGLRQEVKDMRRMARAAKEAIMASDKIASTQTEAMAAADKLANNLEMAAVIERRNAALNINARLKAMSFVNQFRDKGQDLEGFIALLVGSERVREGSRLSVEAEAKAFRAEFFGGLLYDMQKLGVAKEFASGAFDAQIYDALYRMGQDSPDFKGLPDIAVEMAKIVHKYQEVARNRRNRFGAWIRDMKGYITRQSHDMYKIRDAGQDAWVDFLMKRLDMDKMMNLGIISKQDPRGALADMYQDFSTGNHMKAMTADEDTVAIKGGSNLAKRESVSRVLYFRDGVSAYEYNQAFGTGRLAESVLHGLDRAASSAALLKVLGTNPEANLTRMMDEYAATLTGERASKFKAKRGRIMNILKQVDGSVNIPGDVTAAKIGSFLRSWQSMAKLGGALISSVSDLAGYAAELRYQQDKNLLSGVADGIGALIKGRASGEREAILISLGVFHESVASSISARFDSPELVSGKMSAAMNTFFKLNGLTWWTEALRDGAALAQSAYLGANVSKTFDALDPSTQRLLSLYKIDSAKWDLIRMSQTASADGTVYLTPEGLKTVPRSSLEAYITSIGRVANDVSVQNLIDDLGQSMRAMFIDRAHHAVLEPNARARAFMLRGNQPGTLGGELLRYFGQFKSFSIAMTQMVLGREIYGRGYDTLGEYMKNGKADMLGLASMVAMYTVLGYGAASAKDLIKGRTPRDPLDYKTWLAAMAQGGGLGLYGDFLFGEYSRNGRTFLSSVAGPVLGNLDTLTELWTRLRNGDDTAAMAFKTVLNNTPFLNLFWARPLLDYLILFRIQESLNPGYLRRMERRVERENAQTFLFRPSEVVR